MGHVEHLKVCSHLLGEGCGGGSCDLSCGVSGDANEARSCASHDAHRFMTSRSLRINMEAPGMVVHLIDHKHAGCTIDAKFIYVVVSRTDEVSSCVP